MRNENSGDGLELKLHRTC